jgi:hypothetical protein
MILKVERGGDGEILAIAISPAGSADWKLFRRVLPL